MLEISVIKYRFFFKYLIYVTSCTRLIRLFRLPIFSKNIFVILSPVPHSAKSITISKNEK